MSKKDRVLSKEDYYRIAADYCTIAADITALWESNVCSEETKNKMKELEGEMSACAYNLCIYAGAQRYEIEEGLSLLPYHRLSKEDAKAEIRARKQLSKIQTTTICDVIQFVLIGMFCPLFLFSYDRALYGFWHTFFFSLVLIPGSGALSFLLGSAFSHFLTKKASTLIYKPLAEKSVFLSKVKMYEWLSIGFATLTGLLISLCVLYY